VGSADIADLRSSITRSAIVVRPADVGAASNDLGVFDHEVGDLFVGA
jgi:hypothetical protein